MAEESQVVLTEEEYREKLSNPDRKEAAEFINNVMAGNVRVGEREPIEELAQEAPEQPQEMTEEQVSGLEASETVQAEEEPVKPTEESEVEDSKYTALLDEINQKQEMIERVKDEARREREELLAKTREEESKRSQYQEAQKALEQKLSQLQTERNTVKPQENSEDSDAEVYASDYSKQNRREIQQLRSELLNKNTKTPAERKLEEKLAKLEQWEQQQEEQRHKEEESRKTQKLYEDIRSFQQRHPDFKTDADIKNINDDVINFKTKMANLFDVNDRPSLELLVNEFFNGHSNRANEIRQKADLNGVTPPDGYDAYSKIAELTDLKNGYEVDPITGELNQIKDEFGNHVRYRSIDEAYKISNYYNNMNDVRKNTMKEVQEKLDVRNNSAVTIGNDTAPAGAESIEAEESRIRELINMDPREYQHNAQLKAEVHAAYAKLGVQPPVRMK